jgi:hypothetical protein
MPIQGMEVDHEFVVVRRVGFGAEINILLDPSFVLVNYAKKLEETVSASPQISFSTHCSQDKSDHLYGDVRSE